MPSHLTGVPADASVAALIGSFIIIFLLIGIAYYVYVALVLMTIAKKTNTPNAWLAWIPIGNLYLMTQVAKLPWWSIFGFLILIIPFLGYLLLLAFLAFIWWKMCEARGKPGWWGILMIIPLVNLVMMGVVAWKD